MRKMTTILLLVFLAVDIYALTLSSARPVNKHYQVDGQSLILTVGSDLSPRRLRISGTYSVEEKE